MTNVAVTGHTDLGVTNNTAYYYVVRAVNAVGEGAASTEATATPIPPPPAPTGLVATAGNAQVALTWNPSATAASYNVYRGTVAGGPYTLVLNVLVTNYTNTGLTNTTTYYFVVRAVNGSGEGAASGEASATPIPPPPAPTGLAATPGDSQVGLTWNAAATAASYNVYRGTGAGGPYGFVTNVAATNYTNTGLANGTTYYFVVRGVNGSGEGAASNEAVGMPVASSTFNHARGLDYQAWAVALAADGSNDVYAGGELRSFVSQPVGGIVRINSDGSHDPAFAMGTGTRAGYVRAIAPLASGDVCIGGEFTEYNGTGANRILRLNPDGTIDAGFAIGTGFNSGVYVIVPDGAGNVYVGGAFTTYKGVAQNCIVRLDANGAVDATFAVGTGFSAVGSFVQSIAIATDGSNDIYVGGQFTLYNGATVANIVRLDSNGTLDAGFTATSNGAVNAVVVAADATNDVFVGGQFSTFNTVATNRIVRLNSDGTTDPGFASVGAGFNSIINGLLASGTDVYVCGLFTFYGVTGVGRIVRLNGDGTLDAGFAAGTGFNSDVKAMAPDGAGGLFVVGLFTAYNGVGVDRLTRLNAAGTIVGMPIGAGFNNPVQAMAFVPSTTDVYVGGIFTHYDGAPHRGLLRLNSDGTVDPTLATGTGFVGGINALVVAADGDLYVGGGITSYNGTLISGIVRLNPNGTIDAGFVTGTGFNGNVNAMALAPDGSGDLYVAGLFTQYDGTGVTRIVRLNSTGSIDAAFVIGTGFDSAVMALAVEPGGDVYAGGMFTSYNAAGAPYAVRLNSDGSIDGGFATGAGFNSTVNAIALDGSDVYFAGAFGSYKGTLANRAAKVDANGTLVAAFVTGGGFNGVAQALAPAPGGDVYVGGNFDSYNGTPVRPLVRLNSDGSLDAGFPGQRPLTTYAPGLVQAIAMLPDASGRLYMGGNITTWAGTTMDFIARLTAAGVVE